VAVEPQLARPGGISYLRVPAADPVAVARFYASVFGWRVDVDRTEPSFADGSGHVIGHVVEGRVAGEAGVRPYVYVDSVDDTLARAVAAGGETVQAPYAEGNLRVATFRDPAGNVLGLWQQA
jgi:predicted enzyme related to lactoylglutathione lyase